LTIVLAAGVARPRRPVTTTRLESNATAPLGAVPVLPLLLGDPLLLPDDPVPPPSPPLTVAALLLAAPPPVSLELPTELTEEPPPPVDEPPVPVPLETPLPPPDAVPPPLLALDAAALLPPVPLLSLPLPVGDALPPLVPQLQMHALARAMTMPPRAPARPMCVFIGFSASLSFVRDHGRASCLTPQRGTERSFPLGPGALVSLRGGTFVPLKFGSLVHVIRRRTKSVPRRAARCDWINPSSRSKGSAGS
jgi:hypothetical protein